MRSVKARHHTAGGAQSLLNIPSETWGRMGTKEQQEMTEEALADK